MFFEKNKKNSDKLKNSSEIMVKKFDIKTKKSKPNINKILNNIQNIYNEFTKVNLYKDDAIIYEDMQEMISILNKIYTWIYNRNNSNLDQGDVQVFINHLMMKIKNLNNIVQNQKLI